MFLDLNLVNPHEIFFFFAHFCTDITEHVVELVLPKKKSCNGNVLVDHTPTLISRLGVRYKLNVSSSSSS